MKNILNLEYEGDYPYYNYQSAGMVSGYVNKGVNSQDNTTSMTIYQNIIFYKENNGQYIWYGNNVQVAYGGNGYYVLARGNQQLSGRYVKTGEETRTYKYRDNATTFERDFVVMKNTSNNNIVYVVKDCFKQDSFYDDPNILDNSYTIEVQGGSDISANGNLYVSTGSTTDPLSGVTSQSMQYCVFYKSGGSYISKPVPGVMYSRDSEEVYYNPNPVNMITLDVDMSAWPMTDSFESHSGTLTWAQIGMTDEIYNKIYSCFQKRDCRINKLVLVNLTDGEDPQGGIWADMPITINTIEINEGPVQSDDQIRIESNSYSGYCGARVLGAVFYPGTRTVDVQSGCTD